MKTGYIHTEEGYEEVEILGHRLDGSLTGAVGVLIKYQSGKLEEVPKSRLFLLSQ